MPGQKTGAKLTTHNDNDRQPIITFYCEECQDGFQREGWLKPTGDNSELVFVPGPDSVTDLIYCPNDLALEFNEPPVHEISTGGYE